MRIRILLLTLLLAAGCAGLVVRDRQEPAMPLTRIVGGKALKTVNVPKDWGAYRGGNWESGVIFEDQEGTIRFISLKQHLVLLEIRRD